MIRGPTIYYFKRHYSPGSFAIPNAAGTGAQVEWKLNEVVGYGEFTALFDSYRINKIVIKFIPEINQMNTGLAAGTAIVPLFYSAIDYDSGSAPTSAAEVQEYASCKAVPCNKPFTRVVVPRTASPIYRAGVTAAYMMNPARQWIDCGYVDVPHYGLVVWANPSVAANQFSYKIEVIAYLAFKNVR